MRESEIPAAEAGSATTAVAPATLHAAKGAAPSPIPPPRHIPTETLIRESSTACPHGHMGTHIHPTDKTPSDIAVAAANSATLMCTQKGCIMGILEPAI